MFVWGKAPHEISDISYVMDFYFHIRKGYNISFVCRAADNFNVIKHIINLNQTRFLITTNQTIAFKAYEYKKELHIFYIDCLRK